LLDKFQFADSVIENKAKSYFILPTLKVVEANSCGTCGLCCDEV